MRNTNLPLMAFQTISIFSSDEQTRSDFCPMDCFGALFLTITNVVLAMVSYLFWRRV
jgi:hypothetical protein